MTGMEHAIEHAARALWECDNLEFTPEWRDKVWNDMGGPEPSHERVDYEIRAEYLAQFGLLAPAPLREEWGVPGGDGTTVWNHYLNREEARIGAGDDPVVHRWVTEWEEA